MNYNISGVDRFIRVVIGISLFGFAVLSSKPYHWWGLLGLILVISGMLGFCPSYAMLGINTCKKKDQTH